MVGSGKPYSHRDMAKLSNEAGVRETRLPTLPLCRPRNIVGGCVPVDLVGWDV